MRKLPRDLVTILRTEARNQRKPPIDYVIAEDGGRMVHTPEPDIAMAELLEEAAAALSAGTEAQPVQPVTEAHYVEHIVQPLDDVLVNDAGLCSWCDVANARDEIRNRLETALSPAPVAVTEAQTTLIEKAVIAAVSSIRMENTGRAYDILCAALEAALREGEQR